MSKYAEIKRLLKEIIGDASNLPILGEVVSFEGDSCTVKVGDSIEVPDVRLQATVGDNDNGLLLFPKKGSQVLMISLTGKLDDLAIVQCDEVEIISYKQNGLEILIDSKDQKLMIKNQQTSLVDVFSELKTLLQNYSVLYVNPAGTPTATTANPAMLPKLTQFETKFKSILK